jgi:hypothetical protein
MFPCAPPPHPRPGPATPQTRTCTNSNAGTCDSITNAYMPACPHRAESAGGVRDRGSYTTPLGRRFSAGWSEIGRGLHLGDERVLRALGIPNCGGPRSSMRSEADEPVTAPYCLFPPALTDNERTPTAHSRCIQNAPHEPHAHPTPNTDTKPKYLPQTNTS